jgi:hypothetical protein
MNIDTPIVIIILAIAIDEEGPFPVMGSSAIIGIDVVGESV